ncbi:MAG: RNA methyltransferase [Candidatus Kapabacteria bacterium]|nr:RNA methyltransferase [Ignavibacteriota bacterium]MCW5883705.1 RNA methyltransferase [Candidatus Kapabacteria bacterium]
MMQIIQIENINDSRITSYKSMRDNLADNHGNSLFVAESEKVVMKLLQSSLKIHSILARKEFIYEHNSIISERKGIYIFTANNEILNEIIGFRMHTGVMALAEKPENHDLDKLGDRIIFLNNIVDSENVGSIVRNIAAFGFESIITDKSTSSPYIRRAVRVSMGTIFSLRHRFTEYTVNTLKYLKNEGYQIISAEINEKSINFSELMFPKKFVLVFGNEAKGIDRYIIDISDTIIKIPISNKIESLNVAASSGILLYEISRQINSVQ